MLRLQLVGGIDTTVALDEVGYVASARLLAGGYPDAVLTGTFYSVGSSLLLVPVAALTRSATTQHVAGVVINIALASLLLGALYRLLRHHLGATPVTAVAGAAVAGTIPWVTANAATLWAETALAVLVVAWLLAVGGLRRDSRLGPLALALTSVGLYAVHHRMIGLMAVGAALILLATATGRITRGATALAAVGGTAAYLLTRWLNALVADELYTTRTGVDGLLARFEWQDVGSYLDSAAGQSWGILVSTAGLVVPGAWYLGSRAWGARARLAPRHDGEARDEDGFDPLVAVTALVAVAWVGAMSTFQIGSGIGRLSRGVALTARGDLLVYTRYVEPVALVLAAVGAHWVVRHGLALRSRVLVGGTTVALIAALTLWVRLAFPVEWFGSFFSPSNASVVFAWVQRVGSFSPLRIALPVALLAAAMILLPTAGRRLAVVATVAVSLALTHTGVEDHLRPFRDHARANREVALALNRLDGVDEVGYLPPWDTAAFYTYQFWLDDAAYRLVTEDAVPADLTFLIGPLDWPGAERLGATLVASDPELGTALWSLDGATTEDGR